MPRYTEDDIAQALNDVANKKPIRQAAREWDVPYHTLRNRVEGKESHSNAAESQQRLSRVQEDHLTQWVLTQEALGHPPTHGQIKEFAQRVLAIKGDNQPLGKRWIQAFLKRNPILKTKRARTIDSQHVNGATIVEMTRRQLSPFSVLYIEEVPTTSIRIRLSCSHRSTPYFTNNLSY